MISLSLIHTKQFPIQKQLELEEHFLRNHTENICWINEGSPPAIVLGVSAKPEEWVDLSQNTLPILKRFSGGGTVVVNEKTIFVSFIMAKTFAYFPEEIHNWCGQIIEAAHPSIHLFQNDFVIGHKKCGGNAQYIKKDRWIHHTSFLWDYDEPQMNLLKQPPKEPTYRNARSHTEFLTKLKDHFPSQEEWVMALQKELKKQFALSIRSLVDTEMNSNSE